ncbi:hypothetical protein A3Q56_07385 [Intoshia linei]|uniref:Uncharacterized protein n=1 Tax=Intoshia linei TaxID=1819745 RepID=A0A177ASB3_9BILA|nr:hypothetical protein A3Q56_07385 [Intoshia linei]
MHAAIVETLELYNITDIIKMIVCDTTYSNTGNKNGAAMLTIKSLNQVVVYEGCRFHVLDLVIKHTFNEIFILNSQSPNINFPFVNYIQYNFKELIDNYKGIIPIEDKLIIEDIMIDCFDNKLKYVPQNIRPIKKTKKSRKFKKKSENFDLIHKKYMRDKSMPNFASLSSDVWEKYLDTFNIEYEKGNYTEMLHLVYNHYKDTSIDEMAVLGDLLMQIRRSKVGQE